MPHLSCETRDWTHVPVVEAWSQPLDHQGSLCLLLNHECVLDSIRFFFSLSFEIIIWFYLLHLLNIVDYVDFSILNQPCILGVNHSLFTRVCIFLLFVCFWCQGSDAFTEWIEGVPSSQNYGKILCWLLTIFFLKCLKTRFTNKVIWP